MDDVISDKDDVISDMDDISLNCDAPQDNPQQVKLMSRFIKEKTLMHNSGFVLTLDFQNRTCASSACHIN